MAVLSESESAVFSFFFFQIFLGPLHYKHTNNMGLIKGIGATIKAALKLFPKRPRTERGKVPQVPIVADMDLETLKMKVRRSFLFFVVFCFFSLHSTALLSLSHTPRLCCRLAPSSVAGRGGRALRNTAGVPSLELRNQGRLVLLVHGLCLLDP